LAPALAAIFGFPIPLLSADGSTIEQCRWNGLGGADVIADGRTWLVPGDLLASAIAAGSTLLRISNVCADQAAYPSTYTVPVTWSDYIAVLPDNVVDSTLTEVNSIAVDGGWDGTGRTIRGCMASSATAKACYKIINTGYPFALIDTATGLGGPSNRFMQRTNALSATGTLVACANLRGVSPCVEGYTNYVRSATGASSQGNFLAGCPRGSLPECEAWVAGPYDLFNPRPTCSIA
jgi:hypothetical protein